MKIAYVLIKRLYVQTKQYEDKINTKVSKIANVRKTTKYRIFKDWPTSITPTLLKNFGSYLWVHRGREDL